MSLDSRVVVRTCVAGVPHIVRRVRLVNNPNTICLDTAGLVCLWRQGVWPDLDMNKSIYSNSVGLVQRGSVAGCGSESP